MPASGRVVHLMSALFLVIGLFLPMMATAEAAPVQAPVSTDPNAQNDNTVIPSPSQVSISGDFGQFSLTDFDGIWKGIFPVPAGSYSYQFVVVGSDGNQYTIGSGGINGGDQQVTVNDGDAGIFAQFDEHTYDTDVQSVDQLYTLSTANGDIPLQPANGNLTTIVDSQGGDFSYQLMASGNPVGDQQSVPLDYGPVQLTIDTNGNVVNTQTLTSGTLTIQRVDADGNPLPGGCYQLRSGNQIVNQGCDNGSGTTTLTFPAGLQPGNYTVVEVTAPNGEEPAADQDVTLQPGDNSVTIQSEGGATEPTPTEESSPTEETGGVFGEPTEEASPTEEPGGVFAAPTEESSPTEEQGGLIIGGDETPTEPSAPTAEPSPTQAQPGDLIVEIQDQNGQPLPDSCFELIDGNQNVAGQTCDATDPTPNNGRIGFYGVPAGTYTLHMSQAPAGTEPVDDRQVTIEGGQQTNETIQMTLAATPTTEPTATEEPTLAAPTEEPTATQEAPTEAASLTEEGGIIPEQTPTSEVPTETTAPTATTEGPTEEASPTESASPTQSTYGEPGDLIIELRDENDQPVGNSCFELIDTSGNAAFQTCDATDPTPNNGRLGFYNTPSGTYTLRESTVPDGTQPVPDREVTVAAGQETTITLSTSTQEGEPTATAPAEATATPNPEVTPTEGGEPTPTSPVVVGGDNGAVTVDVRAVSEPGTPICVELNTTGGIGFADPPTACDNGEGDSNREPGLLVLNDIAPGEYQVSITQGPDAALNLPSQDVTVNAGQVSDIAFGAAAEPTVTPTTEPTATPTEEPTATPTQEPTATPTQEPTVTPTEEPTATPTTEPTATPTQEPTVTPTTAPTQEPTVTPTTEPTIEPTATPTEEPTGAIRATIRNTDDQVINGACIAIDDGNSVCDNTPNDRDPAAGSILVDDVATGQHSVSVTDFPATYLQPDPQPATVSANETFTVPFVLEAAPPQTGSAQITFTIDGAPLPDGLCVQLTNTNGGVPYGTFCDGDDNDADPTAGVIELQDVPVGTYAVKLTAESQARIDGFKSATTGTLIIPANGSDDVTIAIVAEPEPTTGTVEISTRNNATNMLLGGACYELRPQDGGDTIAVCDNDGAGPDQNGTTGVIRLVDVPAGAYTLVMTTAPDGFTAATDRQIDVTAGVLNQFEVRLDAIPQTSDLTVHKIDQNGDPLKNACFELRQGNVVLQTICDATDGTPGDGTVVFTDLNAGTYRVVETKAPTNDYQLADPVTVRIVAGQDREINVTNVAKTGRLVVTKVDADDVNTVLENACFQLKSDNRTYGPYCDDDDGTTDGKIVFGEIVPDTYTLIETVPPPGYQKADNREITINPGASVNVTVADRKAPPPAKSGTLIVSKQDDQKKPLPGGCFRLYDGDNPVTGQVCDNADGKNDATITFTKVPVGTWTLRETLAPSTDYQIAPDRKVTIENGKTTRVAVPNSLKTGRVQVKKTNQNGDPLQGACFDLAPDGKGPRCTDASGSIIFSVAVGTYSLTETTTPTGYVPASKVENIKVKPGQTTVVNVVNKLAPPPPNTGSVQVFKFVCPAAAGGAKTQFLGGTEGNAQLAKTANCNPSNAAFTLKGENGSGGPGAFTTGADGQYQVTVPAGIYTLTETDPDLPGPSSAKLKVVKGQLTTVIVINYVEPPKPAPATIQVTKYTCPSSFNGTLYDDFRQNCSAQTQLTNNVTVRVQGPTPQKHVTGDSGKKGQSTFSGLTAGTYTLSEDRPFNVPVNYIFCGFDGNWPADYKAVNTSLSFDLQSGQTMNCVLFNIPEVPKKDTGTILVHKYVCDVKNPPKGFDFESECRLSDQNAKFSLAAYNAETQKFDPPTTDRANPDGLLRFKDLKPGTYQLLEVDGKWCHAKSNSVDSKGNVVVKPNAYSEVWIYNCVEPTSPPNTGSGDAAGMLNPGGGNTGTGLLLSVAWPLLAAGAWLAFRNRGHRRALAPQLIRHDDDRRAA